MSGLNHWCLNDVSDEDCYKCMKHGIIFRCPNPCPDFDDGRERLTPEMKAERKRLMRSLGVEDENGIQEDI